MSASSREWRRLQILHEAIDEITGLELSQFGQMGINGGCFRSGMAEVLLDLSEIDAVFQKIGGIGMSQSVDGGFFMDTTLMKGSAESILNVAERHRMIGRTAMDATAAAGRKDPDGIAMELPAFAEAQEGFCRQSNAAMFSAFGRAEVNVSAGAVDIGNAQMCAFLESQSAGVNRLKANAVEEDTYMLKNLTNLLEGQNNREFLFQFGANDAQDVPLPVQRLFKAELDSAQSDGNGGPRPLSVAIETDEVVSHLFFSDLIGRFAAVLFQHSYRSQIGLDGALRTPAQLQVLQHSLSDL